MLPTHPPFPLQLSLLSYFEVSIYYAPRIQSAQRTNENSPAIYRWDHVPNPNESVKRTTESGVLTGKRFWKEATAFQNIQPSASRTEFPYPHLIPPMNRWAIFI